MTVKKGSSKWRWSTLGEVCSKPQYGWTTSGATSGKLRLLRTTDITSGEIDWTAVPFCREEPPEYGKYKLNQNDIVVSRAGSVGVSHLLRNPEDAVFASYLIRFRPGESVIPQFVAYFLQSPQYWSEIRNNTAGIAIPNVNATKLQSIPIPVPPLDEQQRIVAKIEKQFTRLDAGVALLKRVQMALKRYRASVLKAACEGEWESAALGSLSLQSSYGTSVKCSYQSPGIPVLRIPNIQNGRIDLTDLKFATSAVDLDDENALKPNDFLIVRTNGSKDLIGRGAVVLSEFKRPHFFASYLIRFRIRDRDTAKWLSTVWNSENVRKQILTIAATSAGQYNVNQTNLSKVSIPLPPLEERIRIVAEVERRLSVIEELEALTSTELQRAMCLRQSILRRAFDGAFSTSSFTEA